MWPIDVHKLFVTNELLNSIVKETNEYARLVIGNKTLTRKSQLHRWKETNLPEIKSFLGIILYKGLVRKPETADYWSKSILYTDLFVSKLMTRERFEMLLSFVHFNDNTFQNIKIIIQN